MSEKLRPLGDVDDPHHYVQPSAKGNDSSTTLSPDHQYSSYYPDSTIGDDDDPSDELTEVSQLVSDSAEFRAKIIGHYDSDYGDGDWHGATADYQESVEIGLANSAESDLPENQSTLDAKRGDIRMLVDKPFKNGAFFALSIEVRSSAVGGGGSWDIVRGTVVFVFPPNQTQPQCYLTWDGNGHSAVNKIGAGIRAKPTILVNHVTEVVVQEVLLPVELVTPKEDSTSTGYVADDMVAATNLKIAKMEKSLDDQGSLDADKDIDRFYLRIPGFANSNLGAVAVKVTTVENPDPDNYNETATVMNLTADGDDLVSGPMILVSDTVDDNHDQNDNAEDDATHLAQIGGKFRIESITIDGKETSSQIDLEIKEEKTVTINAVVFSDSGIDEPSVRSLIEGTVRERFAQVGIHVEVGTIRSSAPPDIGRPGDPSSEIGIYESHEHTTKFSDEGFFTVAQGRTIAERQTPEIFVFFCKRVHRHRERPFGDEDIYGYAWPEFKMPNQIYTVRTGQTVNQSDYRNNCFINVSTLQSRPFTVPHEIGHLLTNAAHFEQYGPGIFASDAKKSQNLMRGGGTSTENVLGASKRLQQHQEDKILSHPATKAAAE